MRSRSLVVCLFLFALAVFAQSDRGTLTGTVLDPAGAVVANAAIDARNTETGVVYPSATSTTGNYTIGQLPPGTYEITVSVPGFKKLTRAGLTVQVAQVLRVDVSLEVGAASESVTVTEAGTLLNTETADLRHSVTSQSLDDLPVLGIGASQSGSAGIRNPYAMTELIPGSVWQPNSQIRINGTPNNTQSFRIEGQDASNTGTPGVPAQTQPSVDAIQEVAIQTSNYAAEYGQVGGGYFNLTMKSGTNQFHGSAYDYFVNEVFNAGNPYTANSAGNPRPRNRRNDYGFTIGGPVWIPHVYNGHDKTFFFFNWEQYREHVGINTQQETVPTAAYRNGDFRQAELGANGQPFQIGTDPQGRPILQNEIYDPTTQQVVNGQVVRDPFPLNLIPSNRFDPLSAKIQGLFPAPLGPNANSVVSNFLPNIPTSRITEIPSVKIDQTIGSRGKLAFFWQRTKTTAPVSFTFGQIDGLPDPLATNLGTFQNAPVYRLNYDYSLTPTMLLHFGAGYRSNYFFVPATNEDGSVVNFDTGAFGFKGQLTNQFFPRISGLCPGNTVSSCTGQGGMMDFGNSAYAENITQSPSFNTNLTWVKSNHTYKVGAEFRTEGYPAISKANSSGTYAFSFLQTSQPYLGSQTVGTSGQTAGFGYASFLLGAVNSVTIANPVFPRLGKKQFGIFAQDSWKVTRKITFDYGVRYDYSTYLQEQYGRAPFFSPTTPNPAVGLGGILGAMEFDRGGPGHCNCDIAKNYPFAAAPRLGVAYQITPKTVFRAGFGIVYAGTEANNNAVPGIAGSSATSIATNGAAITTLSGGIPATAYPKSWPNLDPGQFNLSGTPVSIAANPFIDPNAGRPARQYQWSIGFERELMKDMAVSVSYVGNRGIWWQAPGLENLNAINPATLAAKGIDLNNPSDVTLLTSQLSSPGVVARGFKAPYPAFPLSQTLAQSLRPFPQYTTINTYWDPLGKTWYDSAQVKVTKRMSHGLSFLSTFVWQKTLVNGTEIGEPNPGVAGGALVNNIFNPVLNKSLSLYDQPLVFNLSLTYVTPKINGNKLLSWIVRDWTYGAFLQYSSGMPIQVPFAANNLGLALFNTYSPAIANVNTTGTFVNRKPGVNPFAVDLNCHCYDPNATFVLNKDAWTQPGAGQFGSSAAYYSDYRYQRRPLENMNVGRTWKVKERYSFSVRMEFSNIFNRGYWGNPTATNITAPQTRGGNGNAVSGFGFINTQVLTPQAGIRSGTLVARFTF